MTTTVTPVRPNRLRSDAIRRIIAEGLSAVDEPRLAVAFHEAGHAVAAVLYGGRVSQAIICPAGGDDQGRAGRTEFDVLPEWHRPEIFYAGPWSEARHTAGRHPGPAAVRRAFTCGGHFDDLALIAAGGQHLGHAVTPLLTRSWPAVHRVAARLFFDGQAGHREICVALGITDDGGPGSAELAGIRAGLRGVG